MKWAAVVVAGAAMMFACKNENKDENAVQEAVSVKGENAVRKTASMDMTGYEKSANGLYYKFEKRNPDAQQVQMGDVLFGKLTIKLDTLTLRASMGKPDFFAQAVPNWEPKIYEGLLMMHEGEVATFAYEADTLVKMLGGQSIHPDYKAGSGQMIVYTIDLQRIESVEEAQKQQEAEMKKEEPSIIRNYVKQNNIKVKPNANGLYIIVNEKGTGEKVANGKEVTVHYTGRLLDGTVFDSSVERGQPFSFKIGAGQVIQGWDKGLLGQTVGSKLQLIIPSKMGYGERGAGGHIPPYTPLVFDVEIISVK